MSTVASPEKAKTTTGRLLFGLAVLVLIVAVVIGIDFLGNPYYALAHLAFYGLMVALVWLRLKACFRLVKADEYSRRLYLIGFWLMITVLGLLAHVGDVFESQDRKYIRLATNIGMYLALLAALELIERLLEKAQIVTTLESPEEKADESQA